jgi:hypothetical protein
MAGRLPELAGRLQKLTMTLALLLCLMATLAPVGNGQRGTGVGAASAAPLGGVNVVGLYTGVPPARADSEIAAAHKLHAAVVRAEIPWSAMEPSGPNQIEPRALAFADRLVSDAAARGIRVILFVDSTPCWASSAPASLLRKCRPGGSNRADAWPPTDPSTYATFVAYLAQRYGTRLAAIEIWNEPDQISEQYFAGPEKARRYATILRAAYPAIKQANPNLPVLAGSIVGYNGVFLRALYAAGIKGYYDGLAVHFYGLTLASLRSIHQVQLANGDTKPLWLDEFGWSSCWPKRIQEEQVCVTKQVQGTNLANIFRLLAHTPYIAAETMYDLQESASEQFGVLTRSGRRKPAFAALSRALASPSASPSPVVLSLHRQGNQVVASGSGPVGDYMQLEAFQGSVLRYRALFTLNRFNQFSIALPSVLGTGGLTVRVYQDWTGPGMDAQKSI